MRMSPALNKSPFAASGVIADGGNTRPMDDFGRRYDLAREVGRGSVGHTIFFIFVVYFH